MAELHRWWKRAIFYQIYIRSFADGNGDGIGDFIGMRERLDHLAWLGVDAVWITPFYSSPMADHGYDVADYRTIDPMFGTLDDCDRFLADAHALGIKVIADIVPNHTSNEHPWFRNALSDRNHPDRDKYIFRDPGAHAGPPNNWMSVFGGPAWTFHEPTGQWYLHLFAPEQPDLNWRNPEVSGEFESILQFWFDRGVDGFRIDVAHGLFKDPDLRDVPAGELPVTSPIMWDQPEVHDIYRSWRKIADSYRPGKVLVGEVYLLDAARVAPYLRPDELHLSFNFPLVWMPWDTAAFRSAIEQPLSVFSGAGSECTWVLSNHDVDRHVSRFGGGEVGLRRGRAAVLLLLSLPGPAFLYQGEELGLEQADVPDDRRQDPIFFRTEGALKGRDGCRVPIPWTNDAPGYGFSGAEPWLPMPSGWGRRSAEALQADETSILHLYRRAIEVRRSAEALRDGALEWMDSPDGCLVFARGDGGSRVISACNFGGEPADIPIEGSVVLASDTNVAVHGGKLHLPGDSAAWILSG